MKNISSPKLSAWLITITLSFIAPTWADASVPEHYQKHCIDCHSRITGGDGSVLYKRKDGIVHSFSDLEQRIAFYIEQLNLGWSTTQIGQITNYLNKSFYRFPQNNTP